MPSDTLIIAIDQPDNRRGVAIPGYGRYEYALPDDLSTIGLRRLNRQWERLFALERVEEMSEHEAQEYDDTLAAMVRTVVPELPDDLFDPAEPGRLRRSMLLRIITDFFAWARGLMTLTGHVIQTSQTEPVTSDSSSPTSSGSTAATPDGGY